MFTFGNLKADIRGIVFPQGEAENLVAAHDKAMLDVVVELQTWVPCLQVDNTDIFPQCATLYNCGLTVFDAPRGIIKSVAVMRKTADGTEDDWCSLKPYAEVDFCHVRRYLHWGHSHGGCCSPSLWFGIPCGFQRPYPTPTDAGLPAGLAPLPLGYHYPQESTNRTRLLGGVWAKDRGKIYIAPWINSTWSVVVKWDGIKRSWSDTDPIDDDPMLSKTVEEYLRWQHSEKWDKEFTDATAAKAQYEEKRAFLIHQCREETRARFCEPSHARSSPARVTTLYYNDEQTVTVSCPEGQTGNPVTVTIPAGTVGSALSKEDANQQAQTQAENQAQAMLSCSETPALFYNDQDVTYTLPCTQEADAPLVTGTPVTVTVPRGTISGATQAAANQNALVQAQAQAAQQIIGHCTYWNREQSYTAICAGDESIRVTKTVTERTYSSTLSQADADAKALADATNQANVALQLVCGGTTYWNTVQTIHQRGIYVNPYTHQQCVVEMTVTVTAHEYSSQVSQADANSVAYVAGFTYLQMKSYNYAMSGHCGVFTETI